MKNRHSDKNEETGVAAGASGSIEQHLDMNESGDLRGDDLLRRHEGQDLDAGFHVDLSTSSREGDDLSGDEHSSGLQGDESELHSQPHISSGMPGDGSRLQSVYEELEEERISEDARTKTGFARPALVGTRVVAEALSIEDFPATKSDLYYAVGDLHIEDNGVRFAVRDLLDRIDQDEFSSAEDAVKAIENSLAKQAA